MQELADARSAVFLDDPAAVLRVAYERLLGLMVCHCGKERYGGGDRYSLGEAWLGAFFLLESGTGRRRARATGSRIDSDKERGTPPSPCSLRLSQQICPISLLASPSSSFLTLT